MQDDATILLTCQTHSNFFPDSTQIRIRTNPQHEDPPPRNYGGPNGRALWVPKVLSLMCVIVKDLSRVLRRVLGLQISEKLDPKRAEKGAFECAVALGWDPKPVTLLPES